MSIMPMPDLTPEAAATTSPVIVQPAETIHLSSLDAYAGKPGALQGVTFWWRVAARCIDLAVHYFVALCCGALLGLIVGIAATLQHVPAHLFHFSRPGGKLTVFVFALLGSVVLRTICEGFHGSTLGKILLGFAVVQEDGTPCRPGSALIRSLAYFVDALFFGLIGYFAMQKTPQQQRHGDEWAHTIVCHRSDIAPENRRSSGYFIAVFLLACMADATFLIIGLLIQGLG